MKCPISTVLLTLAALSGLSTGSAKVIQTPATATKVKLTSVPVTISVDVQADAKGQKFWIEGQNKEQVDPWRCSGDLLSRIITVSGAKGIKMQAPEQGSILLRFDPEQERFTRLSVQNDTLEELESYEFEMACRNNKASFRTGNLISLAPLYSKSK